MKPMKSALSLLLTLILLLGLGLAPSASAEIVNSGQCGTYMTWVFDHEGRERTVVISGHGRMWEYSYPGVRQYSSPWANGMYITAVRWRRTLKTSANTLSAIARSSKA